MRTRIDGTWPGPVTLQRGWSRAVARPWNQTTPMAHLRVLRGGPGFIAECAAALLALSGVQGVLSPPLLEAARPPWSDAGFSPHARLVLMRRDLEDMPGPALPVASGDLRDLDGALGVDNAAFDDFWRFDRTALQEAVAATARSAIHVVRRPGGGLTGFAVTGVGHALAYLQRVAVDPAWQGRGLGRSLVRAGALWARDQGASAMLLNTPEGNRAAAALYRSEGFHTVTGDLTVLARTP